MQARVFIAILALSLLGPGLAAACSRAPGLPEPTLADLYREASAVFIAHVSKTEEVLPEPNSKYGRFPYVIGHFQLIEKIKGEPPESKIIKDQVLGPGNCSVGLMAGWDYVVFLRPENEEFITTFSGSEGTYNLKAKQVQEYIEKIRALK